MKNSMLAENIKCSNCEGSVKLTNASNAGKAPAGVLQVEFHYVCVVCGHRASAQLDGRYLSYSERKFCQDKKLEGFEQKVKGMGVVVNAPARRTRATVKAGKS